jgi:membrane-associated phospholipid phosphatase
MNDFFPMAPAQKMALKREHVNGLRAPGHLARRPGIGVLLVLFGLAAFGVIVIQLQTNGPLIQLDYVLNDAIHGWAINSSPFVRGVMIVGYYLGQHIIIAIGVVLLVYFIYKRFWPEAAMVVIAWAGEGAMWMFLSGLFERSRPVFDTPVWHQMTAPGFPSGHSISAVMCYGLLAYLLAARMSKRPHRALAGITAIVIIVYIGFSRVFVGHHYLSDVLAGLALGVAWSALVYTSVEWIAVRRGWLPVQR